MSGYIEAVFLSNPITATPYLAYSIFQATGGSGSVFFKEPLSLTPQAIVDAGVSSLVSVFQEIWFWILHNLLTPAIIIIALLLFFYAQYWLVRMYIFTGKYVISTIQSIAYKVAQSKEVKEIMEYLDIPLFEKGGTVDKEENIKNN